MTNDTNRKTKLYKAKLILVSSANDQECRLTIFSLERVAWAKLRQTDSETHGISANFCYCTNVANSARKLGEIAGVAEWTHHLRLTLVDGLEGAAAHLERVVLVVLQLVLICRSFVTRLQIIFYFYS